MLPEDKDEIAAVRNDGTGQGDGSLAMRGDMRRNAMGRQGGGRIARSLLLAAGLMAALLPASAVAAGSLAGQTIVIDPGHGGMDGGATAYGRVEKLVTLPIGLDLSALLRGAGARVVLTRGTDQFVSLANRTSIANAAGADAFVSIHANALSEPSYSGLTTFFGAPSGFVTGVTRSPALVSASRALASDVQAATQARTGASDRGIQQADYYVLGNAQMPAILVETGFITNPAEGQRLVNPAYQESLAAGIANGLARFAANPGVAAPNEVGATPAGTASAAPGAGNYLVRPGDTLSAVAVRFGVPESALRAANALPNSDLIYAGQRLTIAESNGAGGALAIAVPANPSPSNAAGTDGSAAQDGLTYTVQPGDTLSGIAQRLGVRQSTIAQRNGIANSDRLYAGQTLQLPSGGPIASASAPPAVALPSGQRYRIRVGDTLSGIALRLGISEHTLVVANQLSDLNRLVAGRYLAIPSAN